jgi:tetratricopeptide (TPR) repeat protein
VVQVGDEAEIELSGTGWVYLGEGRNREGLGFRRRYSEGGNTVFVFDVKAAGDYLARFQRQDLEKGVFAERRVAVEGKPAPATGGGEAVAQLGEAPEQGEDRRRGDVVNGQESGEGQEPEAVDRSASLEEARALLDEGKKEEALEAFLQSYPPGDSEVHDTIASLARDLHRTAVARSHWSENLDAGPPWAQRARMGLLELSLESKDSEGAWEHYAALRDADSEASDTALNADSMPQLSAQQLRRLGLLLLDSEDPARAVEPLETYLEGTASPEDPAELFYRLGRLYEQQHRASRALEYYRRVVNDYPLSTHWAPAEERVHYLKRHFFDIR